ncbi:cytochrome c oxidase assembly protein subunit 17 [Metschnikowia aff. pulcherrima]|uniref:Cytochrome c oxidase assembly protein subunit 17 n=1 Tax=Metschnikowia aff. pulcherrima TaxID=2163413 RepID=A0A4P6XHZ9_9ASCO|nr:cytochrome c oxidase assembly protein subunit 17 [Metschnikowia aff. pulcherrima]
MTEPNTPNKSGEASKPKPCCVCLDEKKARDECLLFNGEEGGKCLEFIDKYKACMKGYGFKTN